MGSRAELLAQFKRGDDRDLSEFPINQSRTGRHSRTRSFATDKSETATKAKSALIYTIGIALPISLVAFTVQTELAQYIQANLHYEKPYFMLYITHSSWWLNGVFQFLYLRATQWNKPSSRVAKNMWKDIKETARSIQITGGYQHRNLALHMIWVVTFCGVCLTIAGATWYVAVNLTTAADLSAIYNSSAFFAYVFSVPILKERVRRDKVIAVTLSVLGVLIIAYGDRSTGQEDGDRNGPGQKRLLGNVIIAGGAVLYGLYEVLYKKYGCPVKAEPNRSVTFANAMATGLGTFTLCVMWIPIPILHFLGLEKFEFPPSSALIALAISIAANFIYSACLLAMISLTSPVLSSVACLLSIFVVAITDTFITGNALSPAALIGGLLIGVAFAVLSWATYVEMQEEEDRSEDGYSDIDSDLSDEENPATSLRS